jgi:hypothetical protein
LPLELVEALGMAVVLTGVLVREGDDLAIGAGERRRWLPEKSSIT